MHRSNNTLMTFLGRLKRAQQAHFPALPQTWSRFAFILLPLLLLPLASLLIIIFNLDLWFASLIYGENGTWPGVDDYPWATIYRIAAVPAMFIAAIAAAILLAGLKWDPYVKYRIAALYLLLALALGPGLVVNVVLKDNLGRPRPREVVEFGGKHLYTQAWQPGDAGSNSSFPSGHASVAFFLLAPFFLWRRSNKVQSWFFLWVGLAWGSLVGLARMLQGGHFLSDVLWAGGLVYLCCAFIAWLLKVDPPFISAESDSLSQEPVKRVL
jgi:membrane-associated PAP2 superfamily phosphatase